MRLKYVTVLVGCALTLAVSAAAQAGPAPASGNAPTDEIQVYDAAIAPQGKFNLTFHANFTPRGTIVPAFPGGLISNHSLNGAFEWAYGARDWLELGLYLPLYSIAPDRGAAINGGKLRILFVSPHAADRKFFYGANFEFSYNARHWDPRRYTSEIRPIVGTHLNRWDFIFNPILDNSWQGGFKSLDFAPAARAAYHLSKIWAAGIEEYGDYGELRDILPGNQQTQTLWAVLDHNGESLSIEGGIGFGLTSSSDKLALKLILSRDLN
ncbi:MAG: hypothetical protein ACTHJX_12450 [Terriglobales bacterium]